MNIAIGFAAEATAPDRGGDSLHIGTRLALLDAAQRLLVDTSFEALTLGLVADAAGLSRRTAYNHFANKQQLYRAALERQLGAVARQLQTTVPAEASLRHAFWLFTVRTAMVLGGDDHVGIVRCLVRDSCAQAWLGARYEAEIRAPVLDGIELWLLRNHAHRDVVAPRQLSTSVAHLLGALQGLTVAPRLQAGAGAPLPSADDEAIHWIVDAFLARHGLLEPRDTAAPGTAIAA